MPIRKHPWTRLLVVFLLAVCCGCGGKTDNERTTPSEDDGVVAARPKKTVKKTTRPKPKPEEPPKIPTVAWSKQDLETCRVVVGGTMPEAELLDTAGKPQALKGLYGERLTVVCLWSAGKTRKEEMTAREMLGVLADEVAAPYAGQGVRVVAVNVKDSPEVVAKLLPAEDAGKIANLTDPQGAFFDKLATERLPRIYLLDSEGRILWFDMEYSNGSMRLLQQGLKIALTQKPKSDG
jgi:hypothetical protein